MSWLKEYKSSLKNIETEEILDLILYRPMGFLLVKLVLPFPVTPNQLTLTALFFGFWAGICYTVGNQAYLYAAAGLYFLFNVFDCADGMLARIKRNGTPTGRIIDGVADYFSGIFVFGGIAIGSIPQSHHTLSFWLVFAGAIVSIVFHSMNIDFYRARFMDIANRRMQNITEELEAFREELKKLKKQKKSPFSRLLIKTYLRYAGLQKGMTGKQKEIKEITEVCPDAFYRKNHLIMRFWTFLGPTTQISAVIVFSILGRLELLFYWYLIPMNAYFLIIKLIQFNIDCKIKKQIHESRNISCRSCA